ncbi:MAG: MarR family winged helix-turn-helix transcriptional regulator [Pseudonocardiaceae bacterium]
MGTAEEEREALLAAIESHEAALRRRIARHGPNPMFDSGLTMQQLRVLTLLSTEGPLAHSNLAQALGVGLATVTGLVDRLVARGLVERVEDVTDRRIRRVRLTADGVKSVERMESAGQEVRHRLLRLIDLDALRGLEHGLVALRAALEREQT